MQGLLIALAALAFAAPATVHTDQTDIVATVQQFVTAFNKGDVKQASATCVDQAIIIDDFPPHEWHGAGSCLAWMNAYDADAKKNGIADGIVKLGTARHVDVTADHAYAVFPATYTYKQKGKPVIESGSTLIVALEKAPAGWHISGWAWSKH